MGDRAIFFVAMLKGLETGVGIGGMSAKQLILEPLPVPLAAIEAHCRNYIAAPSEQPLSIHQVTVDPELLQKERKAAMAAAKSQDAIADQPAAGKSDVFADSEADLLSRMPQFVH